MFNNLNYKVIIPTLVNILVSFAFSFFLSHTLTKNSDALNLVANIFSILSGFLLLVITMSGENSTSRGSNSMTSLDIKNQEIRFSMRFKKYYTLFLLYILTLVFIFIYYLIIKDSNVNTKICTYITSGIEHIISFLTCFSFIQSTFIPLKIKELFEEKNQLLK